MLERRDAHADARALYRRAAGLEEALAHEAPIASPRVRGVLVISAVSLWVTIDAVEAAAAFAERIPNAIDAADADLLLAAQAKLGGAVWVRADEAMKDLASSLGVDARAWTAIDAAA